MRATEWCCRTPSAPRRPRARAASPVPGQGQELRGQALRVVRLEEQAAARPLEHLGEGPVARLDAGDAVGEGLQEVEPLGLGVRARHGQRVETLEEGDLLRAVEGAVVAELALEAPLAQARPDSGQVATVLRGQVAGGHEPGLAEPVLAPEDAIGLGQQVQALLRGHPGEVAEDEGAGARLLGRAVPVEVDAEGHRVDPAAVEPEVPRHEVRVVLARRHEAVHRASRAAR